MLAKKSLESGQEVDVRRKRQAVIPDIAAALLWSANRRAAPFVTGLIKNLWDYYAGVGQYSVAQALFEQVTHSIPPAEELDPNQREILAYAHVSIGTCHLRVGRYDAANQHLQQALTLART